MMSAVEVINACYITKVLETEHVDLLEKKTECYKTYGELEYF